MLFCSKSLPIVSAYREHHCVSRAVGLAMTAWPRNATAPAFGFAAFLPILDSSASSAAARALASAFFFADSAAAAALRSLSCWALVSLPADQGELDHVQWTLRSNVDIRRTASEQAQRAR